MSLALWDFLEQELPAEGEEERFITAFTSDEAGEIQAKRLGNKLAAVIVQRHLQSCVLVRVQRRTGIGWGIWIVLTGK